MASWREIERFKKDAQACRVLAGALLSVHGEDLSEWETEFLLGKRTIGAADDLSTRQAEKLLEIRDQHQAVTEVRGFSVLTLLNGCYAARLDLSDTDEDWIVSLRDSGKPFKRRDAARLLRCARELNIIETEYA